MRRAGACGHYALERVISVRLLRIGNIKVADIGLTVLGNSGNNPFDQITVRIDEDHALARFDVGENETLEQCGLARPSFPNDVHMREAVGLLDAENSPIVSGIRAGEMCDSAGV